MPTDPHHPHPRALAPVLQRAASFVAGGARLLDRHRFRLAIGDRDAAGPALAALASYRNADGGYGWGLEPDLRAAESQPGAALHAFEVFAEVGPTTSPAATDLCDWLGGVALGGGALPFALPVAERAATQAFWADADPTAPSLQITAAVLGPALRTGRYDPAVAAHPWVDAAVGWCLEALGEDRSFTTLELLFGLGVLDQLAADGPGRGELAARHLARLAGGLPPDGSRPVEGGAPDERIRALDFAPLPGTPIRRHLDPAAVEADLDRLAGAQLPSGGWHVDFHSASPIAELEWDGYATVNAVRTLLANGRLAA